MLFQLHRYEANLKFSRTPRFKHWAIGTLRKVPAGRVVRIHVSGDFYSAKYIRTWEQIIKACPHLKFYYYTRSWSVPSLRGPLDRLGQLPNVSAWYSGDRDSFPVEVPHKTRIAYMQIAPDDIPRGPVDLLFRDYPLRDVIQKKVDGKLVCPHENGLTSHISCDSCKICTTHKEPAAMPGRLSLTLA